MELIFLTGMSGGGKSQAAVFFEDQGFFCIDNLPPMILPEIVKTFKKGQGGEGYGIEKIAFVVDVRSKELLKGFDAALKLIDEMECAYKIVFLEASDAVLVSRYKQSRRKHPLGKELSLTEAISKERRMLQGIRGKATYVIDTSDMAITALREELGTIIEDDSSTGMSIMVESFGFKYGLPADCDNVIDVRFLPNPFYIPQLQLHSGKNSEIADYLNEFEETKEFLNRQISLYSYLIPYYIREGKGRLHIGVGCTGGRHRSVYVAETIYKSLLEQGYKVIIHHRDIDKDPRYQKQNEDKA